MKKVIILCITVLSFTMVKAQMNNQTSAVMYLESWLKGNDYSDLLKARARIDTAAVNPSTIVKPKTWFYRGKIYEAIFEKNFNDTLLTIKETDMNKKNMLAYQKVSANELEVAIISYKKCLEVDTKNDWSEEAKKLLRTCVENYASKAYSMYYVKKYAEAVTYSEKAFEISQKYIGKTDTFSLNTAAYCAAKDKQYDKSITLYEKLIALGYKPVVGYAAIIELNKQKADDASLKTAITKARTAFPNEYSFILEELNLAIKEGKIDDAIKNLNLAIEKDPKNAELHLVLGQTYQKMAFADTKPANFDELLKKSESEFKLATEIKADYFTGYYNFGVFYSNWGANILNGSQKMSKMSDIQAEEKKANDLFLKAIPLLEKAMEINKTDKDTMRALKQLYAKTGQADTDKYKKLNDLLKN